MKKLYADFSKREKQLVKKILWEGINLSELEFIPHTKERMCHKGVSVSDIYNVFKGGYDIIELHQKEDKYRDVRVLLRGKKADKRGYNTCISLSLITGKVITVYKNMLTDNHKTLDEDNYKDVNVVGLLNKIHKNKLNKCLTS